MNFIKPCKHIHIYQTHIDNKTVIARGNSIRFVILNDFCICIECLDRLINLFYNFNEAIQYLTLTMLTH